MAKKSDLFFEIFTGEFVEIIQDFEITASFNIVEDHPQEVRMPMTVTGYLLDSDGDFLYLSRDGEGVDQALPLHTVKHIAIVEMKDASDEILDNTEPPETDMGYN